MPIGGIDGTDNPCKTCAGTGEKDGEFCTSCLGTGFRAGKGMNLFLKELYDDVIGKLNAIMLPTNVFYSHVIWEVTDLTEFTALSADNKDAYRGIVRMGTVSLVDGSHSRNSLWDMFDAESTTRAALLALLT